MADLAIFTVVSNNYLHFARTLLKSVAQHHPEADLYCVIVDRNLEPAAEFSGDFRILRMDELELPDMAGMTFQYDVLELNTAVKPWAFERLFQRGYGSVIYLDPDIFVYRPLSHVIEALDAGADIVITPHLLSPIKDDKRPTELDIRRAGTYNFGFCALRNSENTLEFLHWWQGKLGRDCIVDHDRGIFVDQSWIDLVPGMFANVCILRNAAYNVAYWNVAQRIVIQTADGQWNVDGDPLVFFHFSGFNPLAPEAFSKHQNRYSLDTLGPAADLARAYASALIENGARTFSSLPYGYGAFSDGTAIPSRFRRLYLQDETLRKQMGDDPFDQPGFLMKPAEGGSVTSILPITWAMYSVYRQRPDLQSAFNLMESTGVTEFWNWFVTDKTTGVPARIQELHRKQWVAEGGTKTASSLVCFDMFANMLSRRPSEQELEQLGRLCKSRLGATLALVQIARTRESRNRPRPTRRFKKALRAIWRVSAAKAPQPSVAGAPAVPQRALPRITGLFPAEPDFRENGAWCGANVSVPLGNRRHDRIAISGMYYPDAHARMHGRSTLGLELLLDGHEWKHVELPESGEISISEEVPAYLSLAKLLQIKADRVFVPSSIGYGSDERELSWRLSQIQAGDVVVFDSKRDEPVIPMSELFSPGGFNLIGYVFAELGVGEAARTMARAAESVDIPYSLVDVGYQTVNRQSDRRAEAGSSKGVFDIDILYVNADQTENTLRHLSQKGHPHGNYKIGFWHWEQPRLPEPYWGGFEGLDEIWVPTDFVLEAVSTVSPLPVFKVPHAVDFTVDPRWTRKSFGIPSDKFAALVMYDFHSYRFRKNPEGAIAAFKRAALGRKDMTLVIKTINASNYAEDYAKLAAEVEDLDSVVLIDEVYSREQIYGLEQSCDCMLSLHRAEGFGFGPAEMMFLGKPVIATGWSGNMEFMTHDNSFPIKYELKPLAKPLGAYVAGLDWAEPDIEHAAACLRRIVEDQALAREIGRRAKHMMRTEFSPEVIGRQYRDRLALISMRL